MPYEPTIIADAPVRYFRLGETSGLVATDETGNDTGFYTALGSDPDSVPGLLVGDSDTAVEITYGLSMAFVTPTVTDTITIEVWAQFGSLTGYFDITRLGKPESLALAWIDCTDGVLRFIIYSGAGNYYDVTTAIPAANVPLHIVCVADQQLHIYINGVLTASSAYLGYGTLWETDGDSYLGDIWMGGYPLILDEFAIYDYALTGTEIAAHYTAGSTSGPSFKPYWARGATLIAH